MQMSVKDFLELLAQFIQHEAEVYAERNPKAAEELYEPYRAAGDRLVDAALEFID